MTMGKPMIMGRKTFESFGGPLPGRRHIVLTRDAGWQAEGAEVAASPAVALGLATGETVDWIHSDGWLSVVLEGGDPYA